MRYRLMASYLGASYQAAVGPSDRDVTLFAAPPPPEEHGFSPAPGGIWRKQVRLDDLDALWESRPIGSYHGEPCLVLDDLGDRLHIVYLGMDERRAGQLGYWQVDRGVFEVVVPRHEVTDLAEERHEFPIALLLSTLPRALNAGDGAWLPGRNAPQPASAVSPQPAGGPAQQPTGPGHAPGAPPHMPPGMPQMPEPWQQPAMPAVSGSPPQPGTAQVPAAQQAPNSQPPAAAAAWHGSPAPDTNGGWYYQPDNGAVQNGTGAHAVDPASGAGFPNGYGNALPGGYAQPPDSTAAQYAPPFPPQPAQAYLPGQPAHAYQPGQPVQAGPQPPQAQAPPPPPQAQAAQQLRTSQPLQPLQQQTPPPVQAVASAPLVAPPVAPESPAQQGQFLQHPQSPQPAPPQPAPPQPAPPQPSAQPSAQAPPSPLAQPGPLGQYAPPPLAPQEPAPVMPAAPMAPGYVPSADSATTGPLAAPPPPSPATLVSPATLASPATQPSALSKLTGAVRGRRAARKPRIAMSAVFADLVDMADIPRSAYAVDEEVTGAICLFKTDGGYEVFSCAEDARHEVRFFEEEEAAYFYLFGVLSAEALRNGRLTPRRG
jgi:hypothetical protein